MNCRASWRWRASHRTTTSANETSAAWRLRCEPDEGRSHRVRKPEKHRPHLSETRPQLSQLRTDPDRPRRTAPTAPASQSRHNHPDQSPPTRRHQRPAEILPLIDTRPARSNRSSCVLGLLYSYGTPLGNSKKLLQPLAATDRKGLHCDEVVGPAQHRQKMIPTTSNNR